MSNLFARKSIAVLQAQAREEGAHTLRKSLGSWSLLALGIGAVIGAGIFVRTASAAGDYAGPAVMISYLIAGLGCLFAGLCYTEFAAMIPVSGSAYTYSYATMGELVAWIIGWDLILEYAVAAATVAIAWSEYLNKFCEAFFGVSLPYALTHSPFQVSATGVRGVMNLPAVLITTILSIVLVMGTKESSRLNGIIVFIKTLIIFAFIAIGWQFINPENHAVIIPANTGETGHYGWSGILRGAGVVFFAYIGFDAVSTAAQEAKDPQKGMPFGMLGSLAFCTILYILFSYVLTGIAPYQDFSRTGPGHEAALAYAISTYMPGFEWFSKMITVAILAGFTSVILVLLMAQSRVFFSMSRDGLLPPIFSEVHPKYRTPAKSSIILWLLISVFAAFVPGDIVGDMTSIGTLFAFILICAGIIILRKTHPNLERPFRTPFVPLFPMLGILVCAFMIYGLGQENWLRLIGWLALGLVIYFAYSRHHSKIGNEQ